MRNLPNVLSAARLLATVPLVILILLKQPWALLLATALFVAGSVTDTIDGRLARRYHLVSNLGVFLDLTADKVFVSAALRILGRLRTINSELLYGPARHTSASLLLRCLYQSVCDEPNAYQGRMCGDLAPRGDGETACACGAPRYIRYSR